MDKTTGFNENHQEISTGFLTLCTQCMTFAEVLEVDAVYRVSVYAVPMYPFRVKAVSYQRAVV